MLKLKTVCFLTHNSQFCFAASVSSCGSSDGKESHSHFLNAVFQFPTSSVPISMTSAWVRTLTLTFTNKHTPTPLQPTDIQWTTTDLLS